MKLDVNQLRYLSKDDFRVLQAVELGQKNHEIVPVALIDTIAGLKHGGTVRCLKVLLKAKLVHHENTKYDGYRLTYLGYDYLAIKTLVNRGIISSVGRQIGVGKEADVFEVMNEDGEVMALKLHRLGRTSFRAVKSKRDYLKHRNSFSWLYLSRLAALKEYAFMAALQQHGFPVPKAIDSNRHAVLMTLIDAFPLVQVRELERPAMVYRQCMDMMSRLAAKGLIHCDFNEFNLLIDEEEHLTLIDFPQMVSVGHGNARELFYRDVECVIRFFKKKIGYIPEHDADLPYVRPDFELMLQAILAHLEGDIGPELRASGFEREHEITLEQWAVQQPAEREDAIGARAVESIPDSEEGTDSAVSSSERQDDVSCEGSSRLHISGESESKPHCLEGLQQRLRSAEISGSQGTPSTLEPGHEDGRYTDAGIEASTSQKAFTESDSVVQPEQPCAAHSKGMPTGEAVQERLVAEKRRAKQADRLRAAARSAYKTGSKKTRRKGVEIEL